MRCEQCRKKCIHILCKFCSSDFCSSCVQPEIHKCSKMKKMIQQKRKTLENNLIIEKEKKDWV